MCDIKIFVSHRIDLNSKIIDNPLYTHVRCGAVYDNKNSDMQGDNTGANISSRRMSFCEFTVQYWAWKNIDADYYGLCHYRRYLSFADRHYKTDENNMVRVSFLNKRSINKFMLTNQEKMKKQIKQFDVIVSECADVRSIPTPFGKKKTVFEHWSTRNDEFFEKSSLYRLLELIEVLYPEYSSSANEYFENRWHRGYNCYILRRDLFFKMCEFQFDIMFEFEKRLDIAGYTQTMKRTPAFMGEILYGIFIYHIMKQKKYRIKELQLVFFENTEYEDSNFKNAWRFIWYWVDRILRCIADPILPKNSKRREIIKRVFYSFFPACSKPKKIDK